MMRRLLVVACLSLVFLTACNTLGPKTIRSASFSYNNAIVHSWNQQLLLNLVRLRYRDTPYFLNVGSVTTQYTLGANASADTGSISGGADVVGAGVGIEYSERPTVTYVPVQGEAFARQMLLPVSLEALFLLAQSGWSTELVLRCCVDTLGELRNATALGSEEGSLRDLAAFSRAGELLQYFRASGQLDVQILAEGNRRILRLSLEEEAMDLPEARELRRLLNLPEEPSGFTLVPYFSGDSQDEVGLLPRSVLAIMFFMSKGVRVSDEDLAKGRVASVAEESGATARWDEAMSDVFRASFSENRPDNAFVSVRYRDRWFYIDDSDFRSKETFGLLSYLLALQSGDNKTLAPLQTLSLGR